MTLAQLASIVVGADPTRWSAAGFSMSPDAIVGATTITCDQGRSGSGGIESVSIAGIDALTDLDGLRLRPEATLGTSSRLSSGPAANPHPNGVVAIDHVVATTPDCDRTTAAFVAAGIEPRRSRLIESPEGLRRQTFFWLGDVICELVGPDEPTEAGPARWWGLALTVVSIEETVTSLGPLVSEPRPAVQPGRTVCTLRRQGGLGVPILLISPHVKTNGDPS